ncbi:MAG TPA: Lpg1974 family pore-forming outer membrane protein [Parachlamydiaceae bacterium]|nr:Lpg1974 family pore-forming outer membrane protein [Parachlamydiaceae bacterium]
MKKNTILFNLVAVILCGLTTPAAADFCGQNYNDCCEWSLLDGKVTLGADWLYWKVQQDGVVPGSIVTTTDSTVTPSVTTANKVRPNARWTNGFRVNLGYELPCDCWDVNLAYTYMPSHAGVTHFVAAGANESFLINNLGVLPLSTFSSKWSFHGNNLDLDIGRSVAFGECLTVRPHVGLRSTWFSQKVQSFGTVVGVEDAVTYHRVSVREKFRGYGVEAGLWTDYKIGGGVSLVGHFGGSVLYSKFKVHNAGTTGSLTGVLENSTALFSESDSYHTATPTVDYFVGLQYADTMCDKIVRAHIGWEQHVLFDTNRFLSTGNLSTQGLTLGLDVGF